MNIKIRVPGALRTITKNQDIIEVAGVNTVKEALTKLDEAYPGMAARLYDDKGTLRKFINLYLNEEDVRFIKGLDTPLSDNAELSIVPAVAGG